MAAAINKLKSDSRFVSVFADNTPDVDITFMIPFLQRPTDHYMVGVDNLTISLSALGLLEDTLTEPDPKDIILQLSQRGSLLSVVVPHSGLLSTVPKETSSSRRTTT